MLLSFANWLQTLSPEFGFFRVFQYITFRAVMAAMTSLLIGLAFGPWVIARLTSLKIGTHCGESADDTVTAKYGRLPNENAAHREGKNVFNLGPSSHSLRRFDVSAHAAQVG